MRSYRCLFVVFSILLTVLIATIVYSASFLDATANVDLSGPPSNEYWARADAEAQNFMSNGFYNVYAVACGSPDNDAANYSGGCSESAFRMATLCTSVTANAYVDGYSPSGKYYQDSDSASFEEDDN